MSHLITFHRTPNRSATSGRIRVSRCAKLDEKPIFILFFNIIQTTWMLEPLAPRWLRHHRDQPSKAASERFTCGPRLLFRIICLVFLRFRSLRCISTRRCSGTKGPPSKGQARGDGSHRSLPVHTRWSRILRAIRPDHHIPATPFTHSILDALENRAQSVPDIAIIAWQQGPSPVFRRAGLFLIEGGRRP